MSNPETASQMILRENIGITSIFSLQDYADLIDQICEEHGWNEDPFLEIRKALYEAGRTDLIHKLPTGKTPSDWAILAVTEIVEAFEEHREGKPLIYLGENKKPEGQAIEYADCLIRILHWFKRNNIDPDAAVMWKINYNKTRPYRHGGKKI